MFSKTLSALAIASATLLGHGVQQAHADSLPFIGQVQAYGTNFCPRGWAPADGQLLPIAQHTALFSIIGTIYGGDGRSTMALPNLNMRTPVGSGNGPGLPVISRGQNVGSDQTTMTIANMPSHNHSFMATNQTGTKHGPGTDLLALAYNQDGSNLNLYHEGPADRVMDPAMIGSTGGGQPVQKRSPYLVLKWCIALEGVYPSRS